MEYIYIGKIVGTHGIKGEIKLISDFKFKDKVFKENSIIYIGNSYSKQVIKNYRKHKNYDMILLNDYNNINQVLCFTKQKVYVNKEDLNLKDSEILDEDIIGLNAYINEEKIGVVDDIYKTGINYKIIEVASNSNKVLFPYHDDFIEEINIKDRYIKFKKSGVVNNEN